MMYDKNFTMKINVLFFSIYYVIVVYTQEGISFLYRKRITLYMKRQIIYSAEPSTPKIGLICSKIT